jgi:monoterpene epsilon-lactone hydrolase
MESDTMISWQSTVLAFMLRFARWRRDKTQPLEKFRPATEATLARFPSRKDVTFIGVSCGSLGAEWVIPAQQISRYTILYLHGGGFIIGSLRGYRSTVSYLASITGARILNLDYRLAPEHPFPAALYDTLTAYRWLLTEQHLRADQLVVAGDSSGGALALALVQLLREQHLNYPAAILGFSPALTADFTDITIDPKKELVLYPEMLDYIHNHYLNGADPHDPLVSPIYADLQGYPPLFLQVGTRELLLKDVQTFAERARAAQVPVTVDVWPNMFHGWQLFAAFLPEGRAAYRRAQAFLQALPSLDPVLREKRNNHAKNLT